jgi:enoyl-CoA hydratase/carnithine racemase
MSYADREFKTMLLTIEDGIAVCQFNRPKAFNAVNEQFLDDIYEVSMGCHFDPEVKVIIYTGNDKAFAAGADLKAVADMNVVEARAFMHKVHRAIFAVEDNAKPAIAAVEGLALGGGLEIALSCDIASFADNADIRLARFYPRFLPGGGGTSETPRNCSSIPWPNVDLTGRFRCRLADKIGLQPGFPLEQPWKQQKLAKKITRNSPLALKEAKTSINNSMSMDIKSGCQAEQAAWALLFATEDQKEGMHAFLENRKAVFTGK